LYRSISNQIKSAIKGKRAAGTEYIKTADVPKSTLDSTKVRMSNRITSYIKSPDFKMRIKLIYIENNAQKRINQGVEKLMKIY